MKLTVFTPTYNRAGLLGRLYESLCRQTNKNFKWLVIDDGSADNTKNIVNGWIKENQINIEYFYKNNGGMHTAHNAAYRIIDTELNVCVDSDDFMPDNAVEKIIEIWDNCLEKDSIAGIIGLDADLSGNIIGSKIPENLNFGNLNDLYNRHKVLGDKKIVLRTSVVKHYPLYPEFEKEKLVPLGILYLMIGRDYDFIYTNAVLCNVDYQPSGSSNTILKQYQQSPKGFLYARLMQIKYSQNSKDKIKPYLHLISSSLFSKDFKWIKQNNHYLWFLFLWPGGLLLHYYIKIKNSL